MRLSIDELFNILKNFQNPDVTVICEHLDCEECVFNREYGDSTYCSTLSGLAGSLKHEK